MTDRPVLVPGLPPSIHLLGVGGAGVSAAARYLAQSGHRVTGHDRTESSVVDGLRQHGAEVSIGPSSARELPSDAGLVVRSAAVPVEDPQVREALARGLPVVKYADLVARIAPGGRTLAVAGTHGKTTTSWMLWFALEGVRGDAGLGPAPGAMVGGVSRDLTTNALPGEPGGWFCVEACEYDRSFLRLSPFGAVVTNVEADHLDYYGSLDAVEEAFARFVARVSGDGLVVLGRDVPERVEHAARCTVWRLGRELELDLLGERRGCFRFRLRGPGWSVTRVALEVPGEFNVENAALAIALAVGVGIPGSKVPSRPGEDADPARGIRLFHGVERRFEPWGSEGEIDVLHDYAHHPTEVRVTLEAARRAFPGRPLHVLFQPHQYSRTARFLDEFGEALRSADRVVVSDVYGARANGAGEERVTAADLVGRLHARRVEAEDGADLTTSIARFVAGLSNGACALVIGAGDIGNTRDEIFDELALRSALQRGTLG